MNKLFKDENGKWVNPSAAIDIFGESFLSSAPNFDQGEKEEKDQVGEWRIIPLLCEDNIPLYDSKLFLATCKSCADGFPMPGESTDRVERQKLLNKVWAPEPVKETEDEEAGNGMGLIDAIARKRMENAANNYIGYNELKEVQKELKEIDFPAEIKTKTKKEKSVLGKAYLSIDKNIKAPLMSSVYIIECQEKKMVYVGTSKDPSAALRNHKSRIGKGITNAEMEDIIIDHAKSFELEYKRPTATENQTDVIMDYISKGYTLYNTHIPTQCLYHGK